MKSFKITILLVCLLLIPQSLIAQETSGNALENEGEEETSQLSSMSDEELAQLLTQVDRFFVDQGMEELTVDVNIYRDPSNRLNSRNIREGDPSKIAGLSPIVSHYSYRYPEFYQLTIMGWVLAGSDAPPDRTFFSQLIPMPGAPIFTKDLRDRFTIRYEGTADVDGKPAYKVRYTANDRETEFFDYIIYYIDVERKVILRVESSFNNVWYAGIGEGNFYYDTWMGKYLPIYGHGSVLFYPDRKLNVWGKWYRWNWRTLEDSSEQRGNETQ